MILLACLCAAYLIGSIPTGWMVGRFRGVDVRQQGSGNIGATNVARVAGKLPGVFVLLVDTAKGWLPVALLSPLAAPSLGSGSFVPILLGMAAVAGHVWNPFFRFGGGRGVATSLGVLSGLDARVAGGALGIWIAVVLLTRYVSVASIAAAFSAPFLLALFGAPIIWIFGGIAVSLTIIARHRPNILRLIHGEEHRVSNKIP